VSNERIILHSDLNAFYASVECLYNPQIRQNPVAVCGSADQRHGIVLAKNDAAKKFGIITGEAVWQAKQKCPALVTVAPNFDRYMKFSKETRKIYERYSDRIESFGLDECWIDCTGSITESGESLANEIRNTIKNELGITASIGVSWNKIFAKLGSDMKKPDAVTVINKSDFKTKVWRLPASDLLYIGRSTTSKLARYAIYTIGELAQTKSEFLSGLLGKWGETLWAFANGYDISAVSQTSDCSSVIKSIGNSMTTHRDIENEDDAWKVLTVLSDSVAQRLRESGLRCRTVQISIRDYELICCERQSKFTFFCCTAGDIARKSMELLRANYNFNKPLRSLGVRACDLCDASNGLQLEFFDDSMKRERRERLEYRVDDIRRRFGRHSVEPAVLLNDNITRDDSPQMHSIHPVAFNGL
jgi:DNA polymerase-4